MNQKPASLPLNHRRVFRSGLCAALLLAATLASRAQPVPSPELQFTLSSSIAPVGQDWAIYADARIINPRFWNFMEPVVLSISSPLVTPTACGPLWFGWGVRGSPPPPRRHPRSLRRGGAGEHRGLGRGPVPRLAGAGTPARRSASPRRTDGNHHYPASDAGRSHRGHPGSDHWQFILRVPCRRG